MRLGGPDLANRGPGKARERAPLAAANDGFGASGKRFAAAKLVDVHRRMKFDDDVDRSGLQRLPKMRHQLHVAVPGIKRPVLSAHRHSVQADIGGRDGLDAHRTLAALAVRNAGLDRAHQRALEVQNHIAVVGRAFGKKHERVACQQSFANEIPRLSVAWRRVRSTKTVSCNFASVEKSGQVATSALATNETCPTAEKTMMSSHDVWLATMRTPSPVSGLPIVLIRTPNNLAMKRW